MKTNRRNFIKKSTLTIFGFSLIGKSVYSSVPILATCNLTTKDYYGQGPFYTPNAPAIVNNLLASSTEVGTKLFLSGKIRTQDCSQVLPNAKIEVWHSNDAGQYDNTGFNLRGTVFSDSNGFYQFETIMPGKYLNGSDFRPSHIHFKITPQNEESFITQLYFQGDTSIGIDAAASINSGAFDATNRIIVLDTNIDGSKSGYWDIVIDAEPIDTGLKDIHLQKGMIYKAIPNPFNDVVNIQFGVFKKSNIIIEIVDTEGKIISTLLNEIKKKGKFNLKWTPENSLSNGIYYLIMKSNNLQISYQRLIKK